MIIRTKNLIAVSLALTAALAFSSCSAPDTNDGAAGDPNAPCTISFLTFQSPALGDTFWEEQVAAVEAQYPNLTVEIEYTPGLDRRAYAAQLLSVGNLPDVIWDVQWPEFVKANAILPFDPAVFEKTGVSPEVGAIGGVNYSLPLGSQPTPMIFYNKEKFEALGLEVPTTWDEFMKVSRAIKTAGETPILIAGGGTDSWVMGILAGGIVQADVAPENPDWLKQMLAGEKSWTDPDLKAAVTKWADLVDEGLVNEDALSVNYAQVIAKFVNGEGVMYPMGAWAASQTADFEIGVFPLPTDSGKEVVLSSAPAQALAVSSASKCPAQAQAFAVALATSQEFATGFFTADGLIPSLPGWEAPAGTTALAQATAEIFGDKNTVLVDPWGGVGDVFFPAGFSNEFTSGLQGIITGGSVDDFLTQMDASFTELNTLQ